MVFSVFKVLLTSKTQEYTVHLFPGSLNLWLNIASQVVLDLERPKEPQHLSSLVNLRSRSLYTLGCFEHFLWVQHLDLSNNHLRSTHGMIITSPCILATLMLLIIFLDHHQIYSMPMTNPMICSLETGCQR